jgi:outer membrane protein TolC
LLQAELAESNHITNLVEIQARAGIASDLDVARAQNHADQLALKLPATQLGIDTDIARIMILEGQTTPDSELLAPGSLPPAPLSLPDVVPADLLRLRPQVMAAEAAVATDAASLGFATADLYPQFTLGGSLTLFGGTNFLNPLTGAQLPDKLTLVEGGPGVTIPLFDWGQRYATAKAAQATLAAGIEDYHEAVIEGIGAVDAALAGISASRAELAAATREQQSALRALNSAQILFGRGLTDLSDLLDVEAQRETADMDAVDAEAATDISAIDLYAEIGGGALTVSQPVASAASGAAP